MNLVNHNEHAYAVFFIRFKDEHKLFVVDAEDSERIKARKWHFISGRYIASSDNGGQLYLHNFVMNYKTAGHSNESIDHINRHGQDCRRENLRLVSQTMQNHNQSKRGRKVVLPEDSGIDADEMPTTVSYIPPESGHQDGFAIDINGFPWIGNGRYRWKSTRSAHVSLRNKLHHALFHLKELGETYPELNRIDQGRVMLIQSFNEIIKKSSFPQDVIDANLIPEEAPPLLVWNDAMLTPELQTIIKLHDAGQKVDKGLPDNIVLPPYTSYQKATGDIRGEYFYIGECHPALKRHKVKSWTTSQSKNKPMMEKYKELMEKLKDLQDESVASDINKVKSHPLAAGRKEHNLPPEMILFKNTGFYSNGKSEYFYVQAHHPGLKLLGASQWKSAGSLKTSREVKYKALCEKLAELDKIVTTP
jgi:hypothetical protein